LVAGSTPNLRASLARLLTKIDAWFEPADGGPTLPPPNPVVKRQLLVVTARGRACPKKLKQSNLFTMFTKAKLDTRAYAFISDIVDALGDALFVAAPQQFRLGSVTATQECLSQRDHASAC